LAQLSAKSKATLLLLLFPPLVLLVYAFISYYISSYTQQKSLEVVKKSYAFDLRNRAKKDIQADAYIINNYIDVTDGEKRKLLEYLEIFKDSLGEKENIILLDSNNRVIYSMEGDRKNREVLAIVKKMAVVFMRIVAFLSLQPITISWVIELSPIL
jgi:hypothetical protein